MLLLMVQLAEMLRFENHKCHYLHMTAIVDFTIFSTLGWLATSVAKKNMISFQTC